MASYVQYNTLPILQDIQHLAAILHVAHKVEINQTYMVHTHTQKKHFYVMVTTYFPLSLKFLILNMIYHKNSLRKETFNSKFH
jgi:hypothetical protein